MSQFLCNHVWLILPWSNVGTCGHWCIVQNPICAARRCKRLIWACLRPSWPCCQRSSGRGNVCTTPRMPSYRPESFELVWHTSSKIDCVWYKLVRECVSHQLQEWSVSRVQSSHLERLRKYHLGWWLGHLCPFWQCMPGGFFVFSKVRLEVFLDTFHGFGPIFGIDCLWVVRCLVGWLVIPQLTEPADRIERDICNIDHFTNALLMVQIERK